MSASSRRRHPELFDHIVGAGIRNVRIVAERPNGLRVPFMSCPTPLIDINGRLIGAFDMLVLIRTVPKWFAKWRV